MSQGGVSSVKVVGGVKEGHFAKCKNAGARFDWC